MNKKKRFKTKLSRAQKRKDIIVILSVIAGLYVLILLFLVAIDAGDFSPLATPLDTILFYTIGVLAISLLPLSIFLFPTAIAACVIGSQKGKARRVRDDSTYVKTQSFEYYRDSMSHLTPSIVSLLMDLDIYGEKDITATLLRMYRKGAIEFQEGNRISINRKNAPELEGCEAELMRIIKEGRLGVKLAYAGWKENRLKEAVELGYIQRKGTGDELDRYMRKIDKVVAAAVASMFVGLGYIALMGYVILPPLMEDGMTVFDVLMMCGVPLIFNVLLFIPWYQLAFRLSYRSRDDILWERTPLGNEMAEKIAGLSKFIHDFSRLSQAQKEHVVLWDDYLVFAVVLEENEKIVKDISKLSGINLRRFERF